MDLQRRKQELLDKQLQQQRVLIERLEKNKASMKAEERSQVMQTVRDLQASIEKLKRDLQLHSAVKETPAAGHPPAGGPKVPAVAAKSVEEAKKEVRFTNSKLSSLGVHVNLRSFDPYR